MNHDKVTMFVNTMYGIVVLAILLFISWQTALIFSAGGFAALVCLACGIEMAKKVKLQPK